MDPDSTILQIVILLVLIAINAFFAMSEIAIVTFNDNKLKKMAEDGNKRAAVIFANHYLISKGGGLLVIPESHVPEFKHLLVSYYEGRDDGSIMTFMREKCWKTF